MQGMNEPFSFTKCPLAQAGYTKTFKMPWHALRIHIIPRMSPCMRDLQALQQSMQGHVNFTTHLMQSTQTHFNSYLHVQASRVDQIF